MRAHNIQLIALLLPMLAGCMPGATAVKSTEYLGPFTGDGAALHPDNVKPYLIAYYGTDLGFTYSHGGRLHFLFGDSWATEAYAPIEASTGSRFDDGFGTIDPAAVPGPAAIARGNLPPIRLGQNPGTTEMSAIDPGHVMDLGKTPMGGFSNGADEFGIFNIGKPLGCATDADCANGLTCDGTLGYLGARYFQEENLTLACREGTPACIADTKYEAGAPVPGSGFCVDETSAMRGGRISNLLGPMGLRTLVGLRDPDAPKRYRHTRTWLTNKFMNVTARTVQDFDPARAAARQDYRPATGSGTNRRVFLWGRPGFIGVAANGRTMPLYFAYADMPEGPGFAWKLHYYAGDTNGAPTFSPEEKSAAPVDLDSARAGVQPEEVHDIVNQTSVAWVAPLKKWVMFYGGGLTSLLSAVLANCGVLELFTGAECRDVDMGNGAVRMRTADNPWGPWSPPQDVIVGGKPADGASGQFGPGGALRHPACTDATCAPHSDMFAYHADEYGFFYSANIIEEWIREVPGGVDILWNASTWDPYRVVLLRTRIGK
ncbi:MAG: hypothetical protein A3H91_04615 [Gammaproteobacteria bacterium RIFCSPLOWO2_02_FULL_61_13]|nr:MAG: hypothetical protein A3H91_04615 [Gammaproteobacteria bacterium RIFCSPLOWO2_02_FULL_61_13]